MSSGTAGTKTNNPLAMYDITIPCDKYDFKTVIEFMRRYCKRWCFQQEKGMDTGYIHYQCRLSLISKKRLDTMIKWICEIMPGWHISATSNPAFYTGNEFYVMKEDTRIDGPWTDRIDINPLSIPKNHRGDKEWRPWQQKVLDFIAQDPDDRTVNLVYCKGGRKGKSFFTTDLAIYKKAVRVPAMREARDIMRMIMNVEISTCYFIDLPRATSHKDLNSIYAAIEEIKNGYCYDDRYHFQQKYFEPPHVWVFTNTLPPKELLSEDRWVYWTINKEFELIPYIPNKTALPPQCEQPQRIRG